MGNRILEANPEAHKRYLIHQGSLQRVPANLTQGITTPLYSFTEKLNLLGEPFRSKSNEKDESVSDFVSRRMGPAFLEYGIAPLVSGIWAGNPDELSIKHAFPKVWNLEQYYGSLIAGAIKLKRENNRKGTKKFRSKMISFPNGLIEVIQNLQTRLIDKIELSATFKTIEKTDEGFRGIINLGSKEKEFKCRELILTNPIHSAVKIPFDPTILDSIKKVPEVYYPPVSTLMLGFKSKDIQHPLDGFGFLVPRREQRSILGTIFSSSIFPHRAPEGHANLMTFIGGSMQPDLATEPTESLVKATICELTKLIGLRGEPITISHTYWPQAIPQYEVGYDAFIDSLIDAEKQFPGLYFKGNYRGGPGLNDCIQSALDDN